MDSNITIKIVEPGSDPVVPNTGLFTNGIGGPEATIIGISLVILLAVLLAAILYYRKKKQGKVDSLSTLLKTLLNSTKHKKATTLGLAALALLVSAGTFTALIKNAVQAAISDIPETSEASEIESTATVEDGELVVELGDTPVFAYIPTTITVEEEMPAGYTLKAYSANPTLSSDGTDKTISIVTPANTTSTSELQDNTWGLATEEPTSWTQQIFYSLPETLEEAIVIKSIDDYSPTPAGDTTTVYYGVYITPDMPYGTYTGATVSYDVEENVATVIYDGNGLYFNEDERQTTNTASYIIGTTENTEKYSHTPNVTDEGTQEGNVGYQGKEVVNEVITIPNATSLKVELTYGGGFIYNFYEGGWASMWQGSHSGYTAQNDYGNDDSIKNCGGGSVTDGKYSGGDMNTTVECNITGDSVTFAYYSQGGGPGSGPTYGYYAIVTGYDKNGNVVHLQGNNLVSGEYLTPSQSAYHRFLGWDTNPEATTATYINDEAIVRKLPLTIGETTTLYAIWQQGIEITYNGNGADSTTNMDEVEQHGYAFDFTTANLQVDLLASNFTRDGYGFVGWSTDAEAWAHLVDDDETNNPTIYGPNQTIIINEDVIAEAVEGRRLVLKAVWAPAETDDSGNPVSLQDWQGCSSLTATTYNDGVLTVGKNTITALTDNRDGNIYTVARLADGNCWMTENLRLDNEPELSSTNTNNPSLPLTNNYEEQTTSNFLSATSNDWCTGSGVLCTDQSKLNINNTTLTAASPTFSQDFTVNGAHKDFNDNINSYGNYYNWYSATAGNGIHSTGGQGDVFEVVVGDLCPTGWHLPYGGNRIGEKGGNTSGGFYYLNQRMSGGTSSIDSNKWRSFPNNFVYSGYWTGLSESSRGSGGYYWSSTSSGNTNTYFLDFSINNVDMTNYRIRYIGYSVRCVAPVE